MSFHTLLCVRYVLCISNTAMNKPYEAYILQREATKRLGKQTNAYIDTEIILPDRW